MHGPAVQDVDSRCDADFVPCCQIPTWPNAASEWVTRARHCGWPSPLLVDKLVRKGCLVVPIGHPDSPTFSNEWRYSFSVTERTLVWTFTDVQRKCYFILKMLCKEIIGKRISDVITSYHMNTLILWQVEETASEQWFTGHLLSIVHQCLYRLTLCVNSETTPNYVIPDNNMIDHKPKSELQQVEGVVHSIMFDLWSYLKHILQMDSSDVNTYRALNQCCLELIRNLSN
jgi:hypothetical protein